MNEPIVSIITPLYNSKSYIERTIESVLNQSYNNWELIIVDDCSTDNGLSIVGNYVKIDNRIKVLKNEQNSGAAISRNKAIELAQGKYIAFLDADDKWHPEKLAIQIPFMIDNGYHFTHTSYGYLDEQGHYCFKITYFSINLQ